jgi:hypothetical protein
VRLTFDDAVKDVEADYQINKQKSLGHLQRRIRLHLEAKAAPAEINRELAIVRRRDHEGQAGPVHQLRRQLRPGDAI